MGQDISAYKYFRISFKNMNLIELTAVSPIDGRYRSKTEPLAGYFSEYALIRYRVRVEIEYFIALCELPLPQLEQVNHQLFEPLRDIYRNLTPVEAQRVKDIEKVTNHDVKAVEYFIKEQIDQQPALASLTVYKEFIHFGLTSQDINNTSVPLSIKEALEQVYYPLVEELIEQLHDYAEQWKNIPMLAKTHGQPASPTRLGKEIMVYVYRLEEQLRSLKETPVTETDEPTRSATIRADIIRTKQGVDVLYAILHNENISQMGKREQLAVSETLYIVDPVLADVISSAELTPKETFYCIMQYYGKTEQQKAQCFCCTEQALRSTKSRLGKKLDLSRLEVSTQ